MTNPNLSVRRPLALVVIALSVLLGSVLTTVVLLMGGLLALPTRQQEVATRGAQVMPFDLEQTTHRFAPRDDGALQQVVANDPANATQIARIQGHLQEQAAKFAQGDFGAPAAIHGQDMPGLAALQASAGNITATYSPLPNGGQIRYTTTDLALRHALHEWIAAQLSDHGSHATDGHQP